LTPREIMRRVSRLEIRTRKLVQESLAGSYHSVFKGRGMEFSDVREYIAGDDVRSIDWNVSARTGDPHVKQFTEERELTVMLVIDVSASELFGTGPSTKAQVSAEISALLAFSAIRNNDRVGLLTFSDRIEQFIPPRKGKEHGLRVLRDLLTVRPTGQGTDISAALKYLHNIVRKRAVVFLVSDFQDIGYEQILRVIARKHDLVAISVSDTREGVLPNVGLLNVRDPETGEMGVIDTGSLRVRRAYAARQAEAHRVLEENFRRADVDLLELSTGESYERPLVQFFRERARRAVRAGG
jgi:uncharacterized protein (DUF58 family)